MRIQCNSRLCCRMGVVSGLAVQPAVWLMSRCATLLCAGGAIGPQSAGAPACVVLNRVGGVGRCVLADAGAPAWCRLRWTAC